MRTHLINNVRHLKHFQARRFNQQYTSLVFISRALEARIFVEAYLLHRILREFVIAHIVEHQVPFRRVICVSMVEPIFIYGKS